MKQEGLSYSYRNLALAAIKHYHEMHDILLNWRKIGRFLGERKFDNDLRAYTREEIQKLLDVVSVKYKAIVLLYASTIIMRVFPKQVTEHESPLKFLESPPEYTIVFENQKHEEFAVKGSIEEILTRLNEKGLVVSSYRAKEALNAVVEAFRDDGRISIDRSVDFEGYYYHDGDIHISKVNWIFTTSTTLFNAYL